VVHKPGPDALTAAERAVEYARMVGARDIERSARLTLGGLLADAGDVEAGFAEMYEVQEEAAVLGDALVLGRFYVNLPSHLEGFGRSREAVHVLHEGIEFARGRGLTDTEAWCWANLAESLYYLGRWDEASEAGTNSERVGQISKPRAFRATLHAHLALARGEPAGAARLLSAAREYLGPDATMPQYALPHTGLAIGIAAEGRLPDARAELGRALDAGFPPGTQRYGWPLLLAAARAEADARGLPVAAPGHTETVDRIRTAAKSLATGAPVWLAYEQWVRAELQRAEGRGTPAIWSEAVTAFEPLERPYDLARVRLRLAESLLTAGGEQERDRAAELLRLALAVADHLGARPLAESISLLARRARLVLARDQEPAALTPVDPVEALGLTSREHDVLRLVAAGRSNRQIAEELFISPKTASVHVSNILAKLNVSGRGEAAAVAHRLRLFALPEAPAAQATG
jgi:DNA-binding CsgD family transcriptional regulator